MLLSPFFFSFTLSTYRYVPGSHWNHINLGHIRALRAVARYPSLLRHGVHPLCYGGGSWVSKVIKLIATPIPITRPFHESLLVPVKIRCYSFRFTLKWPEVLGVCDQNFKPTYRWPLSSSATLESRNTIRTLHGKK